MKHWHANPAIPPLEIGNSLLAMRNSGSRSCAGSRPNKAEDQYPISNKEYPMMKDKTAQPGFPPLEIGNSGSRNWAGSTPNKAGDQYPISNKEYPMMKEKADIPALPLLEIGNSLLDIGYSAFRIGNSFPRSP
jgi:hypothetical protein